MTHQVLVSLRYVVVTLYSYKMFKIITESIGMSRKTTTINSQVRM